jgi:hypothetical protein
MAAAGFEVNSSLVLSIDMEPKAKIIKSGTWLYDGISPHEVWIVEQNFNYYDDEGYQDTPGLGSEEIVYQVLVAHKGNVQSVSLISRSADEAIRIAEEKCPNMVWDNHRLQPLFHGRYYKLEE